MINSLSSISAPRSKDRSQKPDVQGAAARAEAFLRELEVSGPSDIDPKLFAECLDIVVTPAKIPGLDGCLLRMGPLGTILYNSEIRHFTRVRFTIAHEIGHWLLHPGQSQAFLCTGDNITKYKGSAMEAEANAFAGALLIPRFLLRGLTLSGPEFLASTLAKAEEFGVSIMATAKRFLDLTPTPALVVFSNGETVRWSWSSTGATDVFLRPGTEIDPDSTAYECDDSSDVALRVDLVENSGEYWFPDDYRRESITVREQSFRLYEDIVMTFMTIRVDS